ncbi:cyclin-like protein, partial [Globomyces pollinis-pini]
SSDAIQAACIFIACREHHSSRTFKEICNLTKVSRNEIVRCFKVLKASLAEPTQLQSLDSWVYRFSSQLDIPQDVVREACKLCDLVSERGTLAGKSPISLVAACLYFVSSLSKEPKSAKNIADIAQCAESTLKNAYKSLYEEREELGKSLKTHFPISHLSR